MADNNFRPYRSRDPQPPRSDAPARGALDDPLAELARLIGQSDPMNDDRQASVPSRDYAAPAGGVDWATDDRPAEQDEFAEDGYDQPDDERYEERHEPPRLPEPYPPQRAPLPALDRDYRPSAAAQFSRPAPRLTNTREDSRGYEEQSRYRDEQEQPHGRQLPAFLPRSRDNRHTYEQQDQGGADDEYAMEDYEEEAPGGRRRGGLVVVAAVLGLAVLGTAGAFAYRAMFGGSMLPSLPPIIKADDGPNKIMPSAANADASTSDQASASAAGSGEKLVPREETPVDVPPAAGAAPRVVATIPIFPDQTPGPPTGQGAGSTAPGPPGPNAPLSPTPMPSAAAPVVPVPSPTVPPAGVLTAPKKVHTLAIRPDQAGGLDTPPTPPPVPAASSAPAAQAAPPRPVAQQHAPRPALAADANAPLSIVPGAGGEPAAAPIRVRPAAPAPTTLVSAAAEPAAPAGGVTGGGYAVQVSSQRSEAEAHASFRALQAKFPDQLGGRQAMVRRADLGDKGVYYRALVGPFASMQQAAEMCSSLKTAGGNCIIQKD
jgi:SPOR domain